MHALFYGSKAIYTFFFYLFIVVLPFFPRAASCCLDQINTWRNEREQVS